MQQANHPEPSEQALILIVDDDPLILTMLGTGLRKAGYEVLEAESGEQAIQLCNTRHPRLAILDIQMSGMNGIETARVLYHQFAIPFMFLSAYHEKDIVNSAVSEGALGYLVKPIEFSQLLPAVATAVARAAEFQTLHSQKEHLETALSQNRDVSVAVGIIVTHSGLNAADAEQAMRQFARKHRIKMADIAEQVINRAKDLNHLVTSIIKS